MRKTKIIATLGPAVKNFESIKQLLYEGMNVARFNFSHGDHSYHKEMLEILKKASLETGIPVALLLDTKGPEIRTGLIKGNKTIRFVRGKTIILTTEDLEGSEEILSISYSNLPEEISPGKHILIADGTIDLEVLKVSGKEIHCIIRSGGEIGNRKNVNVLGVKTALPAVTEQDVKDIMFGIENSFDFIAASFIRKPSDIMEIRGIIDICDVKIDIIAKIEDEEGLENIDEIIRVADGIMIARGDLGVQIPPEEIPLVQKRIIQKCNLSNKAVITATQMLDSMVQNPVPTRAEVTDVANAIFDGTDAIMLSGETANGRYPLESLRMMHKIALKVEKSVEYQNKQKIPFRKKSTVNIADTVTMAACITACDIQANAILTPTIHGNTPKLISKNRPDQFIIAVTPFEEVRRKLLICWGVYPFIYDVTQGDFQTLLDAIAIEAQKQNLLKPFDKLVIVAGFPLTSPVMLNTIQIHLLAEILGKGTRGYGKRTSGKIVKARSLEEAHQKIKGDGTEILLTRYLNESFKPLLKKIKGFVLDEFSSMSWKEIYDENRTLIAVAGASNMMNRLEDEQLVTIDGDEKLIYRGKKPDDN